MADSRDDKLDERERLARAFEKASSISLIFAEGDGWLGDRDCEIIVEALRAGPVAPADPGEQYDGWAEKDAVIKACRDIHVYGGTPDVVRKIVRALSALDNLLPPSDGIEWADLDAPLPPSSTALAQVCETTLTMRYPVACNCGAIGSGIGPCAHWEAGRNPERCPYCDHTEACHHKVAAWLEASVKRQDDPKNVTEMLPPSATTRREDATPLLYNVHSMWLQETQDVEWQLQWKEVLAAIDQHLTRNNYPNAAPSILPSHNDISREEKANG